jgi:RNAse (barnase) inhibitor barstar
MAVYEIDGERFSTLEEFYGEINRAMQLSPWGHNLDAFNDTLRGGFGTPDGGFVIRWKNHSTSRHTLGYTETVRQIKHRLEHCHPSHRESLMRDLHQAQSGVGPTVYDWIIEIIRMHGPEGREQKDGVQLMLE